MPPRPFDTLSLQVFVAACEEGNIARAAARLALVPSALSKRIAAVERQVGTPLLVRGRRGVQPTAAGQTLLRQARELLGTMARMQAELGDFASGVQGQVRVVASVSALAESLPGDIAGFLAARPAVRVSVDERVSDEVVRQVRDGAADLGVLWDAADSAGLHRWPYRSDHLGVLLPPGHALAAAACGGRVRFADTLGQASVGVSPSGLVSRLLERQAALLGHTLAHRMQVSSLDAAARIVAAGLGLAILPLEASAPQAAASRLLLLPLDEPWAERRFVVLSRAPQGLSAAARGLGEHLAACAAAQAAGDVGT